MSGCFCGGYQAHQTGSHRAVLANQLHVNKAIKLTFRDVKAGGKSASIWRAISGRVREEKQQHSTLPNFCFSGQTRVRINSIPLEDLRISVMSSDSFRSRDLKKRRQRKNPHEIVLN